MNEWKPIAEASKIKKGFMRVYSFRPLINTNRPYLTLARCYGFDSHFGSRVCDMYMDIPLPPQHNDQENE